jgi:phospholipid/cholesterol/gamma-HCH transport system ATP-binding protein
MIEFSGVWKTFGGEPVLRGVDLTVREGETLVLLGPSGTGKSVLLKHAIGLLTPDRGGVKVDGISIPDASPRYLKRVRKNVGYVFQHAALFDSMTVLQNLALAIQDEDDVRPPSTVRPQARELLERVNLEPEVLDLFPAELSGGMRKRVGVARAIASRPSYVLYDEPTTGLDPVNADTIDALITELAEELGVTSIVVTHDLESAFQVADRVALLTEGELRACATPQEILESEDPVVRRFMSRRFDTAERGEE